MKLVVGLGNPGPRYARTRHNVGVRVVEALAERLGVALGPSELEGRFARAGWDGQELGLLVPETFMNASGEAVAQALHHLPVADPASDLLVIYDDLDLPLGRLRLRARGGDGGHRGLRDVLVAVGREEVPRLRFGIGRPGPGADPVDFVLAPFGREEEAQLRRALPRAADAVGCFLDEGIAVAMNRFNAAPEAALERSERSER